VCLLQYCVAGICVYDYCSICADVHVYVS
jgi:hypothetical protein